MRTYCGAKGRMWFGAPRELVPRLWDNTNRLGHREFERGALQPRKYDEQSLPITPSVFFLHIRRPGLLGRMPQSPRRPSLKSSANHRCNERRFIDQSIPKFFLPLLDFFPRGVSFLHGTVRYCGLETKKKGTTTDKVKQKSFP
jgi:hypothetical protein